MTEPKRPGLDEAIEAAARAIRVGVNDTIPEHAIARNVLAAAYPVIAAAVRADERAKWASVRQAEWDEGYAAGYHAGYEAATS